MTLSEVAPLRSGCVDATQSDGPSEGPLTDDGPSEGRPPAVGRDADGDGDGAPPEGRPPIVGPTDARPSTPTSIERADVGGGSTSATIDVAGTTTEGTIGVVVGSGRPPLRAGSEATRGTGAPAKLHTGTPEAAC